MTDNRIPWRVATATCGAYVSTGAGGASTHCGGKVEYAGVVLQHEPLQAWLSFSCAQHRDQLPRGSCSTAT